MLPSHRAIKPEPRAKDSANSRVYVMVPRDPISTPIPATLKSAQKIEEQDLAAAAGATAVGAAADEGPTAPVPELADKAKDQGGWEKLRDKNLFR